MKLAVALAMTVAASVPALAVPQTVSPYVGQETRQVKALSADEVEAYLHGDGLGMAKAGELNHYPGPKHVLQMADHLGLTAGQRRRIENVRVAMTAAAVPLGIQIVDAERALDGAFANRTIDKERLHVATARIGELQGRLRAVHLSAHLATRAILRPEQVAAYDHMRGYGSGESGLHHHGS
jgi:Spy/CpxP family protein refolding chaperone